MKDFLSKILKTSVRINKYEQLGKLPLLFSANYRILQADINGISFLILQPKEKLGLGEIRKQSKNISILTGLNCVLYFEKMTVYAKNKLIEEGIPFILDEKQIYLPFLGILLLEEKERRLKSCQQISFLTQKVLITGLYQGWKDMNVTSVAEALDVTKTSITRCFDELEMLELPYLIKRSRSRYFCADSDKRAMWENIHLILRNPLIRTFYLENLEYPELRKSGISALCYYSQLNDNVFVTNAVTKKDLQSLKIETKVQVSASESPSQVIQELGYHVPFGNGNAIDPLTVTLLCDVIAKDDPRVEKAIDEMLEEHVW